MATDNVITTSFTSGFNIKFGDETQEDAGYLSAEVDDREDGLNGGRTSFAPGDVVAFLVYESNNVYHDMPVVTAGLVETIGQLIVDKEIELQFIDTDKQSLPIPAITKPLFDAQASVTWIGLSLGALTVDINDLMTVTATGSGIGVAKVKYQCKATAYRLASPATVSGYDDFSIIVYIKGHLIE